MLQPNPKLILVTEDDEDDYILLRDAFQEHHPDIQLAWTRDGEETLAYLARVADDPAQSLPFIIILDLNMPKVDGREVLREIRATERLKHIPVVVFTNSGNWRDAMDAYRLGVNSFVRKPAGYREQVEFVQCFYKYWFHFSKLVAPV